MKNSIPVIEKSRKIENQRKKGPVVHRILIGIMAVISFNSWGNESTAPINITSNTRIDQVIPSQEKSTRANPDSVPLRNWGTYYGGDNEEESNCVITDRNGNIYITGKTNSANRIASSDAYQDSLSGNGIDAFLAKFDSKGERQWTTYFGGAGYDEGTGLVFTKDSLFLCGVTTSDSLPIDSTSFKDSLSGPADAFLACFSKEGDLEWSTYYGGNDMDSAVALGTDSLGGIYLLGNTLSTDSALVTTEAEQDSNAGGYDAFITQFDLSGNRKWSTYYGGPQDDIGTGIGSNKQKKIAIGGVTRSATGIATTSQSLQPNPSGGQDAFLCQLDSSGAVKWGTYFGGPEDDKGMDVVLYDSLVYITGTTYSDSLPTGMNPYQEENRGNGDAFLAKFDLKGGFYWNTYYGDTLEEMGRSVDVDLLGYIYVSGTTRSTDSIATLNVHQDSSGGKQDAFVFKIDSAGQRVWGTYYGGEETDEANSIALYGNTFIAITGQTHSSMGIADTSAYQQNLQPDSVPDAFLGRMDQHESRECQGIGIGGYGQGQGLICAGDTILLQTNGGALGAKAQWVWYAGRCGPPGKLLGTGNAIPVVPDSTTTYYVRAESIYSLSGCESLEIEVHPTPDATISGPDTLCAGDSLILTTPGEGTDHSWTGPDSLTSTAQNILMDTTDTAQTGDYIFTALIDSTQCSSTDTHHVEILSSPVINFNTQQVTCHGGNDGEIAVSAQGPSPFSYQWVNSQQTDSVRKNLPQGTYTVTVTGQNNCPRSGTVSITEPDSKIDSTSSIATTCSRNNGQARIYPNVDPSTLNIQWEPSGKTSTQADSIAAGEHLALVTDQDGCTDTVPVMVVDSGSVEVNASANPSTINLDDSTTLNASITCNTGYDITWQPNNQVACDSCSSTSSAPTSSLTYRVRVTSEYQCKDSSKVWVEVKDPCSTMFIPTIFSPNGDGNNDTFKVLGGCIDTMELAIYDQWGKKVFVSTNQDQAWDGSYNGKMVNTGDYVYVFKAIYEKGKSISKEGTIRVVK